MNQNEIMYNFLGIFSPFITFFLLKVVNFRAERVVCEFYTALKEKNPSSYVMQTKLVKMIRIFSGMATKRKLHWVHCLGNYLQFIVIVFPLMLFLLHLLFGIKGLAFKTLDFCIIVMVLWTFFISAFTMLLCFRCKKIKKNNPKYSKCELKDW